MPARDIKAGAAYVELFLKDNKYLRGLRRAERRLRAMGQQFTAVGGRMIAVGAGLLAPLLAAAKGFAAMGDQLDKMSSRVGVSVEFLSALGHAAELGGANIETLEKGIRRLQRSALDASRGLSTQVEAFDQLGVSVKRADGQLKGTEAVFLETVTALSRIENETQKAALAQMIFGRSGTMLLPMLRDGKQGMVAMMEEAKRLGIVMSTEDAQAAAVFTDQMTRAGAALKRVIFHIGAALAGPLGELSERIANSGKAIGEWVNRNRALLVTLLKIGAIVVSVGAAVVALGMVLQSTATIIGVLTGAVKALSVAVSFLLAHPVVAALTAIAAAVTVAVVAYKRYNAVLAEHTQISARMLDAGNQLRAEQLAMLHELDALAKKEYLNNQERARAAKLIYEVEGALGDLGLTMDTFTGQIYGMATAWERATGAMTRLLKVQIQQRLADIRMEFEALAQQRKTNENWYPWRDPNYEAGARKMEILSDEAAELRSQLAALQGAARGGGNIESLLTGGKTGAGGGLAAGLGAGVAGEDSEAFNRRLVDRIRDLRIAAIDDERQQALAAIDEKYRREVEAARKAGADLKLFQRAYQEEIANTEKEFAKRRQEEQMAAEQERFDAAKRLESDLARARIEATLSDHEKRMALLALEEREALEQARRLGLDPAKVRQLFGFRRAAAATWDLGRNLGPRAEAAGTFSAMMAGRLGPSTWQQRTAKASEETAKNTAKIEKRGRFERGIAVI